MAQRAADVAEAEAALAASEGPDAGPRGALTSRR